MRTSKVPNTDNVGMNNLEGKEESLKWSLENVKSVRMYPGLLIGLVVLFKQVVS